MHLRCHLVHMQVSNGHGWHGVRKMARANEQQKQQEKQQQKQKLKQKQQQQKPKQQQQQKQKQKQQQEQQQKQKGKQEQQQNGAGETGALSVYGVKARTRTPTICRTKSPGITVCSRSLFGDIPAHG